MLYLKHVNWIFGRAVAQKRLLSGKKYKIISLYIQNFNEFTAEMQEIARVEGEHKK